MINRLHFHCIFFRNNWFLFLFSVRLMPVKHWFLKIVSKFVLAVQELQFSRMCFGCTDQQSKWFFANTLLEQGWLKYNASLTCFFSCSVMTTLWSVNLKRQLSESSLETGVKSLGAGLWLSLADLDGKFP